ncbi:hypothetical protein FACS189487_05090 [Campylobacterota bacterium]|nr:hypothetical protein FACS189487_05090 [Campylobacterota bacterium]
MAKSKLATRARIAFNSASPGRYWSLHGDEIRQDDVAELENGGYTLVVVPDKEFIFHQFDLQRDMMAEQLAESVELKVFQDAGLNPMLEYKHAFTQRISHQDERMWTIGAAAISMGALESSISPLDGHIAYVDAVVPTSTLPYALYNAGLLEPKRDVFIYFQKDSLIISIFDGGEYIYGKSQDHGIKKLMESYAQLSHGRMEYEDFVMLLTSAPSGDDKDQNLQVLSDMREAISNALYGVKNILLYAARVAGVSNPDRVFIGTSEGSVPGLEDLAQELLEIEGHEFIFYTPFFSKTDPYVDQISVLSLLEADNAVNRDKPNPFNLTPKRRPGAFSTRPGGKAIYLVAASLIIAIGWPGWHYGNSVYYDSLNKAQMQSLRLREADFNELQARKERLLEERTRLLAEEEETQKKLDDSRALLTKIHEMRVLAQPAATSLAYLFDRLDEEKVRAVEVATKIRDATIQIRAGRDTRITQLLKRLAEDNYQPELRKITKLEDGAFSAELKVRFP